MTRMLRTYLPFTYTLENNQLEVIFDRNQINISGIMNIVLQNFDVLDFSVKDMDIEAIVKGIYGNGI